MNNLKEIYENNYQSVNNYDAEDSKPFKFAICVEVIDLDSACGELGYSIYVQAAKLPKYLSKQNKKSVANCMGVELKEITVFDVCQYGLNATFDTFHVNEEKDIEAKLNEIDSQLPAYGMLCGFYFDKQMNRLGNTGWDFINGNIGISK